MWPPAVRLIILSLTKRRHINFYSDPRTGSIISLAREPLCGDLRPWSSGFGSNILVMALFRVPGWHHLDGCPVLHLMVSLECPYFLVVLGNISKLCWLHLVFDESLSTLAIDQNRQSFSPRQQYYSVTLLCVSSNPLQTAQYFQNVLKYFLVGWIFHDSMIAQCQVLNPRLDILWRRDWSQAAPVFVLVAPSLIGCYN